MRTRRVMWKHYKSSSLCSKSSVRNSQPGWMQLLTLVISLLGGEGRRIATSSRPDWATSQATINSKGHGLKDIIPDPACFSWTLLSSTQWGPAFP